MQIIISDDAKSAITDIYNYSYNISSNYANRIVNKIYDTIYDLQDSPYIGRNVPEFSDCPGEWDSHTSAYSSRAQGSSGRCRP